MAVRLLDVHSVGKLLIAAGAVLVIMGLLVHFGGRLPVRPGSLPGDITWRGKNTTVYFPVVTSILVSVLLTALMWLFNRR